MRRDSPSTCTLPTAGHARRLGYRAWARQGAHSSGWPWRRRGRGWLRVAAGVVGQGGGVARHKVGGGAEEGLLDGQTRGLALTRRAGERMAEGLEAVGAEEGAAPEAKREVSPGAADAVVEEGE